MGTRKPTVMVSGMIAGDPAQGGAAWSVLQYCLGLRRLGQTVEHSDSRSLRGMITKVKHLVAVEEVNE